MDIHGSEHCRDTGEVPRRSPVTTPPLDVLQQPLGSIASRSDSIAASTSPLDPREAQRLFVCLFIASLGEWAGGYHPP